MTSIEAIVKASESSTGMYKGLTAVPQGIVVRPDRLQELEGTLLEAYLIPELVASRKVLATEQLEYFAKL